MLFDQGIDIPPDLVRDDLEVRLLPERVRYNLRIKSGDVAKVKAASGLKLPSKIGGSFMSGECRILKFGPDEWVVSNTPSKAGDLAKTIGKLSKDFVMSATDISHRNVGFVISGVRAAEAINVGCPLDLSLGSFPVGKAARTIFENAPIQLYRAAETEFHMECWRSFAPYLRDFMSAIVRDL